MSTKVDVRAAGGVVWRVHDGAVQVALVHRPRYDDWSLPKGKVERGESEMAAAVREVAEELGARVSVSRRLPTIRYRTGGESKTVAYWTMRYLSGDFEPNDEVDAVSWLAPQDVRDHLTYADEHSVMADFCSTPLPESLVVLVRHAKAGKRSDWDGDDRLRPLDRSGRAQAARVDSFLEHFAPDRIVSARPVRCSQTVTPLAERLGLTIEPDAMFDDDMFEANPEISEASLRALAVPRHVTVVASQGTTIPGLLDRLAPHLRSTDTRKGAVWVLAFADGALLSADYYANAAR